LVVPRVRLPMGKASARCECFRFSAPGGARPGAPKLPHHHRAVFAVPDGRHHPHAHAAQRGPHPAAAHGHGDGPHVIAVWRRRSLSIAVGSALRGGRPVFLSERPTPSPAGTASDRRWWRSPARMRMAGGRPARGAAPSGHAPRLAPSGGGSHAPVWNIIRRQSPNSGRRPNAGRTTCECSHTTSPKFGHVAS